MPFIICVCSTMSKLFAEFSALTEVLITSITIPSLRTSVPTNVLQSFSKKGYPFDNACCEGFFKYLKKEEVHRKSYHSLHDLELSIFEYIEGFYNSKRPHASLGMLTPNEKETLFRNQL